jgi:hypothetical protein
MDFAPRASANNAGAVVLVNSSSPVYTNFQAFVQPYLDNFGVPYTVQNIASNSVGANLTNYALIIIGHPQLDTNHTYLDTAAQSNITAAVSAGTGLVSFDNVLWSGSTPLYTFVQDIFGFTNKTSSTATTVGFPPTEPLSQMHYITSLHPTNDSLTLSNSMQLTGSVLPTNDTAVVTCGSAQPFVTITKFGQGRAVQWAAFDWTSVTVLGPLNGLDDVIWRGMVWAARKPFVLRGFPHFVTMRVDDCSGPFNWVHDFNTAGFKPYLALFFANVSPTNISDLRSLITNGNATASIHSFTANHFFYFNETFNSSAGPYSDTQMSNNFAEGTAWHATNGIPISTMMIGHYSDIGPNAFAGMKAWGIQYVLIETVPGTRMYFSPYPNWEMLRPYRVYQPPQLAESILPMAYADWLPIPGHPEFNGVFFDPYTEIRNAYATNNGVSAGGDWSPNGNDVPGTVYRGTRQIKRGLDSMTLGNVFTHEWCFVRVTLDASGYGPYGTNISDTTLQAIVQGITNNLASYNPIYVTMDYADQYLRATRTSTLTSSDVDPVSGTVSGTFAGYTDTPINAYVYTGADNAITSAAGTVPVFSGSTNVPVGYVPVTTQLLNLKRQGTNLVFTLVGDYGGNYSIDESADLMNWSSAQTVALTNGPAVISEPCSDVNEYYRARSLP